MSFLPSASAAITYRYYLSGPYYDETGGFLPENATVTPYYAIGSAYTPFNLSDAYWEVHDFDSAILYFEFKYNDTTTPVHQYWLTYADLASSGSNETYHPYSPDIKVFFSETTTNTYTIAFRDYVGVLNSYPYVKINGGETDYSQKIIEKKPVDSQNTIRAALIPGKTYTITFENKEGDSYQYGTLTPGDSSAIELVIRGISFSDNTLLLYKYVHAYAVRDYLSPVGAITTSYEDTLEQTTNVNIAISIASNSTEVYNTNYYSNQSFSDTFSSAYNNTDYQVTITVTHTTYGTLYFKQFLIGENSPGESPFSLDFLGTIPGLTTAYIIPSLLIIFVAGCFSEVSSEVAAVITCLVAWVLFALGWLPITSSMLVTALSLSLLAAIVTVRRRYY